MQAALSVLLGLFLGGHGAMLYTTLIKGLARHTYMDFGLSGHFPRTSVEASHRPIVGAIVIFITWLSVNP